MRNAHDASSECYSRDALPPDFATFHTWNMARIKKRTAAPLYFREWRKHAGLTQEAAGERAELDQSTIQRIENGKIDVTGSNLAALAHAYGCEVVDLFRPPKPPPNELAAYVMKMDAKKRARALRALKAMFEDDESEKTA